jgi:hypothetical protein
LNYKQPLAKSDTYYDCSVPPVAEPGHPGQRAFRPAKESLPFYRAETHFESSRLIERTNCTGDSGAIGLVTAIHAAPDIKANLDVIERRHQKQAGPLCLAFNFINRVSLHRQQPWGWTAATSVMTANHKIDSTYSNWIYGYNCLIDSSQEQLPPPN